MNPLVVHKTIHTADLVKYTSHTCTTNSLCGTQYTIPNFNIKVLLVDCLHLINNQCSF